MNKRVLLIEDKPRYGEVMKHMLEHEGITVTWAKSIQESLLKLDLEGKFDAIIIDGCIDGDGENFDCPPLIRYIIGAKATEILVASSANKELCELMVRYGCTHSSQGSKVSAVNVVIALFKRLPRP